MEEKGKRKEKEERKVLNSSETAFGNDSFMNYHILGIFNLWTLCHYCEGWFQFVIQRTTCKCAKSISPFANRHEYSVPYFSSHLPVMKNEDKYMASFGECYNYYGDILFLLRDKPSCILLHCTSCPPTPELKPSSCLNRVSAEIAWMCYCAWFSMLAFLTRFLNSCYCFIRYKVFLRHTTGWLPILKF